MYGTSASLHATKVARKARFMASMGRGGRSACMNCRGTVETSITRVVATLCVVDVRADMENRRVRAEPCRMKSGFRS